MKKTGISLSFLFSALMLSLSQNVSALPNVVYENDFNSGIDSAWSDSSLHAADRGVTSQYHGNYTLGGGTTLTLTGLDAHDQIFLEFDLYLFHTWDGEDTSYGKDFFSLSGEVTFSETFTNHQSEGQSYPGSPDAIPYGSGASATHVYLGLDPTGSGDGFLADHTSDTFSVTFGGPTTQSDEWWGIDNVKVSINSIQQPPSGKVPTPPTLVLMLMGLMGFAVKRKQAKA